MSMSTICGLIRPAKPVDLSVVRVSMWRELVALDKLQQIGSVEYRERIGPKTEPCGTPYSTADGVELVAEKRTCCTRHWRYDANQFITCPPRP